MLDKVSYTHATNKWNVVPIMYPNQLNFNKALGLGAALIHNLHHEEFNQYNLSPLYICSYIVSKYFYMAAILNMSPSLYFYLILSSPSHPYILHNTQQNAGHLIDAQIYALALVKIVEQYKQQIGLVMQPVSQPNNNVHLH